MQKQSLPSRAKKTKTKSPPGKLLAGNISEAEYLRVVTDIANKWGRKHAFGCYTPEDIRQEIYVLCLEALPRYVPEYGGLQNFLFRHCRNRLINLRRNKYKRSDPPCEQCFYEEEHRHTPFCEKYAEWAKKMLLRHSLMHPEDVSKLDADSLPPGREPEPSFDELSALADDVLPADLRVYYLRALEGAALPRAAREELAEYLGEYLLEESPEKDLLIGERK